MLNPILLSIFGMDIRLFGLVFSGGLVLFFQLARVNLKNKGVGITRDELLNWFLITLLYSIVGSRLYFVLFNLKHYFGANIYWYEFIAIWEGGLALSGGGIFAGFAIWLLCSQNRIQLQLFTDQIAPPLFLLHAVIRFGNFLNGEFFGEPTRHFLGVIFRFGPAAVKYPDVKILPVMLIEMGLCLLGFIIVDQVRRDRYVEGAATAMYLLLFSLIRIFSVILGAKELTILGIDESLIISFIVITLSFIAILKYQLYRKTPLPKKRYSIKRKYSN